jgi:hypothetical protein
MKNEVPLITAVGSWWAVFIGGAFAVLTGVLLGATELMLRPVTVLDTPSRSAEVVFVRGATSGPNWMNKVQQILEGSPSRISFTEGELNRFASELFQQPELPGVQGVSLKPNVRIADSQIQLALIVESTMLSGPLIFQSRGHFAWNGECFVFASDSADMGALPIPNQAASALVNAFFARAFGSAEARNFRQAWLSLDEIVLDGNSLSLSWR